MHFLFQSVSQKLLPGITFIIEALPPGLRLRHIQRCQLSVFSPNPPPQPLTQTPHLCPPIPNSPSFIPKPSGPCSQPHQPPNQTLQALFPQIPHPDPDFPSLIPQSPQLLTPKSPHARP